ncbi:MAG: aldo/keto reductase, partial [Staphylococcus xylosus]
TSVARQIQNKEVFDFTLEHEDIEKINTLTQKDGRLKGQDPAVYEEF